MRWLYLFILFTELAFASCPTTDLVSSSSFASLPKDLIWHDYLFIEVEGESHVFEGDTWFFSAWYAPIDIDKDKIDDRYKDIILNAVNEAKLSVTLKSSEPVADKNGKYSCYYKSAKDNIIFVSTKCK